MKRLPLEVSILKIGMKANVNFAKKVSVGFAKRGRFFSRRKDRMNRYSDFCHERRRSDLDVAKRIMDLLE